MKSLELTEDQKNRAVAWVEKKTNSSPCYSCGKRSFLITDHLVTPIVIGQNNSMSIGGTSYPQFMVVCANCGNTTYYNAVISGIASGDNKEEPKK